METASRSPSGRRYTDSVKIVLLILVFFGLLECVFEIDNGFTGSERVLKHLLLGLELVGGVIGGLDTQADPALGRIHLDHAGGDFVANLEHVLDLVDVLFADL